MIEGQQNVYFLPPRRRQCEELVRELRDGPRAFIYSGLHEMGKAVFVCELKKLMSSNALRVVDVQVERRNTALHIADQLRSVGVQVDQENIDDAPNPEYGAKQEIRNALAKPRNWDVILLLSTGRHELECWDEGLAEFLVSLLDEQLRYRLSVVLFTTRPIEVLSDPNNARPTSLSQRLSQRQNRRMITPYDRECVSAYCRDMGIGARSDEVYLVSHGHPSLLSKAVDWIKAHPNCTCTGGALLSDGDCRDYCFRLYSFLRQTPRENPTLADAIKEGLNGGCVNDYVLRELLAKYGFGTESKVECPSVFSAFLSSECVKSRIAVGGNCGSGMEGPIITIDLDRGTVAVGNKVVELKPVYFAIVLFTLVERDDREEVVNAMDALAAGENDMPHELTNATWLKSVYNNSKSAYLPKSRTDGMERRKNLLNQHYFKIRRALKKLPLPDNWRIVPDDNKHTYIPPGRLWWVIGEKRHQEVPEAVRACFGEGNVS